MIDSITVKLVMFTVDSQNRGTSITASLKDGGGFGGDDSFQETSTFLGSFSFIISFFSHIFDFKRAVNMHVW